MRIFTLVVSLAITMNLAVSCKYPIGSIGIVTGLTSQLPIAQELNDNFIEIVNGTHIAGRCNVKLLSDTSKGASISADKITS